MSSNKTNFSLVCYLFKSRVKQNGQAPVLLRININGEKTVLQLKLAVVPIQWDQKRGCVIGRSPDAKVSNDYIDSIKLRARQKYNELLLSHDVVTPVMLKDAILGINSAKPKMIIEVWQEHLDGMIKLIGKETTVATCQKYNTAKKHFEKFLKKHYKVGDISVKSIDGHMVSQFGLFLKTDGGCGLNTTTKFLQNFKKITNLCLRNGWVHRDPFLNITLSLKEVERPYLNEEELTRLMEFSSSFDRLNKVKDFFVFSCFTGLAYADVKKLRRKEIERSSSGNWIRTKRQKTGAMSNIPLLKTPLQILEKYANLDMLDDDDPVMPIISNQKMNAYLKELADLCGITKPLSFHTARHTFATTVTMTNGVPMESVSKMLGHKNLKSTQHYARIVDHKVEHDMAALAQKLNANKKFSY
ncbi:MAG: site-specific integrase [Saprospiraceae bacterium]